MIDILLSWNNVIISQIGQVDNLIVRAAKGRHVCAMLKLPKKNTILKDKDGLPLPPVAVLTYLYIINLSLKVQSTLDYIILKNMIKV